MKTFDPSVILELQKEGFMFFLLATISLQSGDYRYTDADIDIGWDSQIYQSNDFIFDKVETSGGLGVDSLSVNFNNADLSMGAMVLSEDVLGRGFNLAFVCGVRGGVVLVETQESLLLELGLGKVLLETDKMIGGYSIIGGHNLFYGFISNWKITESTVWFEIQNELAFWSKRTLRKCSHSCVWEFKGLECTYSGGESWCNQSYERCVALSNSDHFGGFRFLPEIAEKEIWWGRSPE